MTKADEMLEKEMKEALSGMQSPMSGMPKGSNFFIPPFFMPMMPDNMSNMKLDDLGKLETIELPPIKMEHGKIPPSIDCATKITSASSKEQCLFADIFDQVKMNWWYVYASRNSFYSSILPFSKVSIFQNPNVFYEMRFSFYDWVSNNFFILFSLPKTFSKISGKCFQKHFLV